MLSQNLIALVAGAFLFVILYFIVSPPMAIDLEMPTEEVERVIIYRSHRDKGVIVMKAPEFIQ